MYVRDEEESSSVGAVCLCVNNWKKLIKTGFAVNVLNSLPI